MHDHNAECRNYTGRLPWWYHYTDWGSSVEVKDLKVGYIRAKEIINVTCNLIAYVLMEVEGVWDTKRELMLKKNRSLAYGMIEIE